MENKIKRPTSVLIAQLILLCFLLLLFIIPIKMSMNIRTSMNFMDTLGHAEVGRSMAWREIFPFLLGYFLIFSTVIILYTASSIGLAMRHRIGRWLGVFSLLLLSFALVTHSLGGSPLMELFDKDRYEYPIEVASVLQIFLALVSILIAMQITFFKDARIFFHRQVVPVSGGPPPPPPLFDS